MSDEAITKPTIETLLERVNLVLDENRALREAIETRLKRFSEAIETHLDRFREAIEIRLDRIEIEVKITHSELFSLRADFKELRAEFHEFRPQFKQPT